MQRSWANRVADRQTHCQFGKPEHSGRAMFMMRLFPENPILHHDKIDQSIYLFRHR